MFIKIAIRPDRRGPTVRFNKNCLGSFQVLWNKNCTTENEEIMMKKLIENLNPKKQTK
jgi:hypothetical protein